VSVQVVDVKVENELLNLGFSLNTKRTVGDVRVVGSISVKQTVVFLIGVEDSPGNNLEVEQSLGKRG